MDIYTKALLVISLYVAMGLCWDTISKEYIYKSKTLTHSFISVICWPLDIVMGAILINATKGE